MISLPLSAWVLIYLIIGVIVLRLTVSNEIDNLIYDSFRQIRAQRASHKMLGTPKTVAYIVTFILGVLWPFFFVLWLWDRAEEAYARHI